MLNKFLDLGIPQGEINGSTPFPSLFIIQYTPSHEGWQKNKWAPGLRMEPNPALGLLIFSHQPADGVEDTLDLFIFFIHPSFELA